MKDLQLTPAALSNHEEFFPGHVSTLRQTDPEFIELFDNWAFDEVPSQSRLSSRERVVVILAATLAAQALAEYQVMVGAALNVGLTVVQIKEILYQSVPYLGIARVFEFLGVTNELFRAKGISLPLPAQRTTTAENRNEAGLDTLRTIFGDAIDKMRQKTPPDQAHIQAFLSGYCFGGHYTRGGLDLRQRELITFVMLATLGGCEPQVRSHIAGNLKVGNDRAYLVDVVTQILPYIGFPRALNAFQAINEVTTVPQQSQTN